MSEVRVDQRGWVHVFGYCLSQREALELSLKLAQASQDSRDRDQMKVPGYYHSERIIWRMQTPLGRAITALKKAIDI